MTSGMLLRGLGELHFLFLLSTVKVVLRINNKQTKCAKKGNSGRSTGVETRDKIKEFNFLKLKQLL